MHKHHRKTKGEFKRPRNANRRISPAATTRIETLIEGIDGTGDFSVEYLQQEYLSKFCAEDLIPAEERRDAAIWKWIQTELRNSRVNDEIRTRDPGYNILPRVTWKTFTSFTRKIVSDVLGPLHDELVLGSFSGGASTSRRRASSHPAMKFSGEADVTSGAGQYVDLIYALSPFLKQYQPFSSLREVKGAVLFTVPKKTEIDRCACKEPDINMYLQKGVGNHIRRRLLRYGINLNDQSINRRLARIGSIDGSLATLDLSSASDTITIEAVRTLLPSDWFLYLNDIRSQLVEVNGCYIRTEMFSSMGNGFTFELESLLFYALMRTVSYFEGIRGVVSVYGDDIIIPSGMYDMATWALDRFGFQVNLSKSFHTGSFRESCGGHYHAGDDVTPFYLKRRATHLTDVIRVANQLRQWAFADPSRSYAMPSIYKLWTELASYVPKGLWGGRDYALDTQLVAPVPPISRLVRLTRDKKLPAKGAYVLWHNSNWNRRIEPEGGFEPVTTDTFCRLRPAPKGAPYVTDYFYEEIVGTSDPA